MKKREKKKMKIENENELVKEGNIEIKVGCERKR